MVPKSAGAIDPNLRANYYYPTARKRYLPRIKKASDEISGVPDLVAEARWEEVTEFCTKTAEVRQTSTTKPKQGVYRKGNYGWYQKNRQESTFDEMYLTRHYATCRTPFFP